MCLEVEIEIEKSYDYAVNGKSDFNQVMNRQVVKADKDNSIVNEASDHANDVNDHANGNAGMPMMEMTMPMKLQAISVIR